MLKDSLCEFFNNSGELVIAFSFCTEFETYSKEDLNSSAFKAMHILSLSTKCSLDELETIGSLSIQEQLFNVEEVAEYAKSPNAQVGRGGDFNPSVEKAIEQIEPLFPAFQNG